MEKIITLTITIFGALAVIGGWIFALGVLYQSLKEVRTRLNELIKDFVDRGIKFDAHVVNNTIHRDPERDGMVLRRIEEKLDTLEKDFREGITEIVRAITTNLGPKK